MTRMLVGEVFRLLLDKLFYSTPATLDGELTRLERIAGSRTYCIHFSIQYNGRNRSGEFWMSAAFDVRSRGSIGLPTETLRSRTAFQSIEEPRALWDWALAAKDARGMQGVYLDERFFPHPTELSGEALMDHNLAEALELLAAPLVSLRAITWHDDRGCGSGIKLNALIASNFPQADNRVTASMYEGADSPEDQAVIRGWGERTAAKFNVPFTFD